MLAQPIDQEVTGELDILKPEALPINRDGSDLFC